MSHGSKSAGGLIRAAQGLAIAAVLSLGWPATIASAQSVDTILFNGKVVTVDKDFSVQQALAIGGGKIIATGSSDTISKLAVGSTRMIDLGGRTVIPGLTDGHIHGIRAALTFGTEVNWIGTPSLKEALEGPERQIIRDVLESNGWNRNATADQLGINRTTLYKKMKRLGLEDGRVGVM